MKCERIRRIREETVFAVFHVSRILRERKKGGWESCPALDRRGDMIMNKPHHVHNHVSISTIIAFLVPWWAPDVKRFQFLFAGFGENLMFCGKQTHLWGGYLWRLRFFLKFAENMIDIQWFQTFRTVSKMAWSVMSRSVPKVCHKYKGRPAINSPWCPCWVKKCPRSGHPNSMEMDSGPPSNPSNPPQQCQPGQRQRRDR